MLSKIAYFQTISKRWFDKLDICIVKLSKTSRFQTIKKSYIRDLGANYREIWGLCLNRLGVDCKPTLPSDFAVANWIWPGSISCGRVPHAQRALRRQWCLGLLHQGQFWKESSLAISVAAVLFDGSADDREVDRNQTVTQARRAPAFDYIRLGARLLT